MGLTRAEQRDRRTSIVLLATLFLMHPRIPLAFLVTRAHCWLMAKVVHQHTQVPLSRAALQQVPPKPVLVHGVVPSQVQDSAPALLELHQILVQNFLYCFKKIRFRN